MAAKPNKASTLRKETCATGFVAVSALFLRRLFFRNHCNAIIEGNCARDNKERWSMYYNVQKHNFKVQWLERQVVIHIVLYSLVISQTKLGK